MFKDVKEKIVNRILLREDFSQDEDQLIKTTWSKIYKTLINDDMITKELAIDILDYLFFIRKIEINCITFQSEVYDIVKPRLVKSKTEINAVDNYLCDKTIDELIKKYNKNTLPSYVLYNDETYTGKYRNALSNSDFIPKLILFRIVNDFMFSEDIYNSICLEDILELYEINGAYRLTREVVKIAEDFRCNKIYNNILINELIRRVKKIELSYKGSFRTADLVGLIVIIFNLSDELFKKNIYTENIKIIEFFKNQMIEVINDA